MQVSIRGTLMTSKSISNFKREKKRSIALLVQILDHKNFAMYVALNSTLPKCGLYHIVISFPYHHQRKTHHILYEVLRQKKKKTNLSGNMPEKKWVDRSGFFFFFFFFFFFLREALPCKISEHRYTV